MRKKGGNTSRTHHRVCFGRSGCTDAKKAASPPRTPRSYWSRYLSGSTCKKIINSFCFFVFFASKSLHISALRAAEWAQSHPRIPLARCKQRWFPSCQKKKLHPASSEIMSKNQFSRCLLSALLVLTLRSGQLRPSVRPSCPSGCSHLLSTASPGAQDQGKKLTEPRSCPRGLKEGLWLLT